MMMQLLTLLQEGIIIPYEKVIYRTYQFFYTSLYFREKYGFKYSIDIFAY